MAAFQFDQLHPPSQDDKLFCLGLSLLVASWGNSGAPYGIIWSKSGITLEIREQKSKWAERHANCVDLKENCNSDENIVARWPRFGQPVLAQANLAYSSIRTGRGHPEHGCPRHVP